MAIDHPSLWSHSLGSHVDTPPKEPKGLQKQAVGTALRGILGLQPPSKSGGRQDVMPSRSRTHHGSRIATPYRHGPTILQRRRRSRITRAIQGFSLSLFLQSVRHLVNPLGTTPPPEPITNSNNHQSIDDVMESVIKAGGVDAYSHLKATFYQRDYVLYDKDMVLTQQQFRSLQPSGSPAPRVKRKATTAPEREWPNGVIPYEFSPSMGNKQKAMIQQAMDIWEKSTCIRFQPVTDRLRNPDRVYFTDKSQACSSHVGKNGGQQAITLAAGCWAEKVILHELGHAIGLIHEHQRPDRDQHVTILPENVIPNFQNEFMMFPPSAVSSEVLYDYRSIMHFGQKAFNSHGRTTIMTKNPDFQDIIGHAEHLSQRDIQTVNLMYRCGKANVNGTTQPNVTSALNSTSEMPVAVNQSTVAATEPNLATNQATCSDQSVNSSDQSVNCSNQSINCSDQSVHCSDQPINCGGYRANCSDQPVNCSDYRDNGSGHSTNCSGYRDNCSGQSTNIEITHVKKGTLLKREKQRQYV
ncbi:hypothetical protein ACOMHN_053029 [Nucella lapillus]